MDQQTKDLILSWLREVGEAVKQGAQFVTEQTPLVIQEKLAFARAESTAWLLVGIFLLGYAIFAATRLVAAAKRNNNKVCWSDVDCITSGIFIISGIIATLSSFITITTSLSTFLKVWFAPRVYVLEWIASGLK